MTTKEEEEMVKMARLWGRARVKAPPPRVALALARLLDDQAATPQHPSAAVRLIDVMARLRADAVPRFAGNVTRIRKGGRG